MSDKTIPVTTTHVEENITIQVTEGGKVDSQSRVTAIHVPSGSVEEDETVSVTVDIDPDDKASIARGMTDAFEALKRNGLVP